MKHSQKNHTSIVNRRIAFCQKMRRQNEINRLASLKDSMKPIFDGLVIPETPPLSKDLSNTLFSTALIQFGISSFLIV